MGHKLQHTTAARRFFYAQALQKTERPAQGSPCFFQLKPSEMLIEHALGASVFDDPRHKYDTHPAATGPWAMLAKSQQVLACFSLAAMNCEALSAYTEWVLAMFALTQ